MRNDASVWELVERFLTGPARHVVVVDGGGHYVGIVCTRHLAAPWPLDAKRLKASPVDSLGCAAWIALRPHDDLRTCAQTLTEYQFDAAPVLDEDAHHRRRDGARHRPGCRRPPEHRQRIWQE